MDGSCSLDNPAGCAVAVTYEIIATPKQPPSQKSTKNKGKSEHEEISGSAIEIVKIYERRIAQSDLVLDTKDFQRMSGKPTELSCMIM